MRDRHDPTTEARIPTGPSSIEARHRPRYALLVMSERETASLFPLPEVGDVTLGRSDQCTLRIDDPLLSRVHAVVRRRGETMEIADRGSMNGTWVGDERLVPDVARPLVIGDVIKLGKTNVVLQFAAGGTRPRRICSHGYFEARLEEECARSEQAGRAFAVVRVQARPGSAMATVERTLVEMLRPIDVLATYADEAYEALLVETPPHVAQALQQEILARLHHAGVPADVTLACYPEDGRTPESLVSRAGQPAGGEVDERGPVLEGAMARLMPLIDKVAASEISVLLLGETGVGKEVLARLIHARSSRGGGPLVALSCASLAEPLLESALFGHEKGAFEGAAHPKAGLIESAAGGTVFLDEIGEMPTALQARLLRVIEQREVLRVGATAPRAVDVRFVAATNRDLYREIAAGHFRQDLFFRLNGFAIVVPPLRERVEEIEPLARHFLALACARSGRAPPDLGGDALSALRSYEWPGNVRELKNVIDRAALLCNGSVVTAAHVAREPMGRMVSPPRPLTPTVSIYDASFEPVMSTKVDLPPRVGREATIPPPAEDDELRRPAATLEAPVPGGPSAPR